MTLDKLHRDELERLIMDSLGAVSDNISEKDRADICEYLDHGEYGVAYDLLYFLIERMDTDFPSSLIDAGKRMGVINL